LTQSRVIFLLATFDGIILLREGDWLQVKAHHGPIPASRRDTWLLLANEPMAGLRFLALNRPAYTGGLPGVVPPGRQLKNAVEGLLEPEIWKQLQPVLDETQIGLVFPEACKRLMAEPAFVNLAKVASPPLDPYRDAIAEALVALAIALVAEKRYPTARLVRSCVR
jgi:hypothetical protein